jgi:AcrR family transcriptional regulator
VSSHEVTHDQILQAARDLLETRGYHGVGLEQIARAAKVSRQAVYLHFGSKAQLLLALVDWVDRKQAIERHFSPVHAEPDPARALERAVHLAATYAPGIHKLALVLESARRSDPDAAEAWDDRMRQRRKYCRGLVTRLANAGRLESGWTVDTATDFVWTMISVETYDNVTAACGWSPARAAKLLSHAVVRALVVDKRAASSRGRRRMAYRRNAPSSIPNRFTHL